MKLPAEYGIQGFVDQAGLAGTTHAGNANKPADGNIQCNAFEIVTPGTFEAEEAIRRIGDEDRPQEDSTPRWSNVAQVVLWGLYCALRTPKDFISAMRTAIGAGGEADACGAIAGAMIGAHVGYRALPRHLVKDLWGADAIREVGKAFFEQYAAANPNAE